MKKEEILVFRVNTAKIRIQTTINFSVFKNTFQFSFSVYSIGTSIGTSIFLFLDCLN